jgi:uncharacterized membrane protein
MYQLSTRAEPDRRASPWANRVDMAVVWLAALAVVVLDLWWTTAPGWWRGLVGVPFGLAAPGYTLAAAVFPRGVDLEWPARAALSLVLSVGATGGVVFCLSRAGIPVTSASNLGGLLLVMGVATGVVLLRRRPSSAVSSGPVLSVPAVGPLLLLVLVLAISTALVVVPAWQQQSPAAWVTAPRSSALTYPYEVTRASPAAVALHVENPSRTTIRYTLIGRLNGRTVLHRFLVVPPGRTVQTLIALPDTLTNRTDGEARFTLTLSAPGSPALTRQLVLHYTTTSSAAG